MSEEESENNGPIPGQRSPFRIRGKKDNKTYVEPDARLIRTENVQERGGWMYDFRKFIEDRQIHYYVFAVMVMLLTYYAASQYYPNLTPLITGLMAFALIVAAGGAYHTALHEDKNHREWIHVSRFEAEEIDLGPDLDDLHLSRKIIKVRTTEVRLYEMRDYMRYAESEFRLHFENDQIFEGLTKIHEVTTVDDTGRIFIGERDGIPAGVVFKMGMPSVDYVSKNIEKVKKDLQKNGNKYEDIQAFAKMHKAWAKQWDYMQKFMKKKGVTAFSMEDVPKWAKNYFLALEKASLPFWRTDQKTGELGMGYFHELTPEVRLSMLLQIQRDYNQIRGEKIQLITSRETDMLDAEAKSVNDVLAMLGIVRSETDKILLQREMSLTPVEDKAMKDKKEEIGIDE